MHIKIGEYHFCYHGDNQKLATTTPRTTLYITVAMTTTFMTQKSITFSTSLLRSASDCFRLPAESITDEIELMQQYCDTRNIMCHFITAPTVRLFIYLFIFLSVLRYFYF